MGDIIIILVVAVALILAVRGMISRGKNGCCGGSVPKTPKKSLSEPVLGEKIVAIDGMHCENCKNSVERQINRIDGAAAKVNLKKNVAVVSMSRQIPDEELIQAVERAGFKAVSVTDGGNRG